MSNILNTVSTEDRPNNWKTNNRGHEDDKTPETNKMQKKEKTKNTYQRRFNNWNQAKISWKYTHKIYGNMQSIPWHQLDCVVEMMQFFKHRYNSISGMGTSIVAKIFLLSRITFKIHSAFLRSLVKNNKIIPAMLEKELITNKKHGVWKHKKKRKYLRPFFSLQHQTLKYRIRFECYCLQYSYHIRLRQTEN